MTIRRNVRVAAVAVVAGALAGGLLTGTGTALAKTRAASTAVGQVAAAAAELTPPTTGLQAPNPALIRTPEGWVMLNTGNAREPGLISRAPALKGPWTRDKQFALLTRAPSWAQGVRGIWAPSIVQASDGRYVVFYSAPVEGTDGKRRCIGTGYTSGTLSESVNPAGEQKVLFKPRDKPLVCYSGSGADAADTVDSTVAGGIIDATPAVLDGRTYLTYKTEKKIGSDWLTTTRLLQLDPANPDTTTIGASTQMTRWNSPSIEENPILIKRGDTYTLFTSRGWFKTCDGAYPYHTVYRQTKNLNNWPAEVKQLGFNAKISTCGKGNATVNDAGDGRFFLIWNGHYPESKDTPEAPQSLYIGKLGWTDGKPRVTYSIKP